MLTRYMTQMSLAEVGAAGQRAFSEAEVVVVGAGGLGCALLPCLAGSGVGHIHIVDGDSVEESNLHRQTFYTTDDIGKSKAHCMCKRLSSLNPTIHITPHNFYMTSHSAEKIISEDVIVIDAADNFATTYMLSDICQSKKNILISGSAVGLGGYAGVFCGNSPSYRAVFPDLSRTAPDCRVGGVLGPVVALIGTIQAQLCLSLLLNKESSLVGTFYRWDAQEMRMSQFSFHSAKEPRKKWPFLSWQDIDDDDLVIDVRIPGEKPTLSRNNIRSIPLDQFTVEERDLSYNGRIVLCCQTGIRAARAAEQFYERGKRDIAVLALGKQAL
ncbi:HesA/MoeB/ThiF family protein [Saccharibacter floricola]|uniref:Thiamin biosynthesis protein ThiF n=1 Tax=Saccharibacter floricola DSM 15669 TaxID=1123227 RepID=A0ABQ0NWJ4_9PROT|nr:HesA/MoeB/ThiF family protein [Saccharibacter floricola]GBQ04927.1 thiamin biosynthesis protein ThiF [Saccharibacter floricola DSM 15669]